MSEVLLIWLISCLAETNRKPSDFAEGESELVLGYNTEYSSAPLFYIQYYTFALIMLAEYTSIILMSSLFRIIFLWWGGFSSLILIYFLFLSFVIVWVRGTLPRFRYDKLMNLASKCFLPFSISYVVWVAPCNPY